MPVFVKKARQTKELEPRSDSIGTEKALARHQRGLLPRSGAQKREYDFHNMRRARVQNGGTFQIDAVQHR